MPEEPNTAKYYFLTFPKTDWGVVMPKGCPLADKQAIEADNLTGLPLFCSEQGWRCDISKWCGSRIDDLHLEGSFRTFQNYNKPQLEFPVQHALTAASSASMMVSRGIHGTGRFSPTVEPPSAGCADTPLSESPAPSCSTDVRPTAASALTCSGRYGTCMKPTCTSVPS